MIRQMDRVVGLRDIRIVDQLIRVKALERDVARAFERSQGPWAGESLCNRVAELQLEADLLEQALDAYPSTQPPR